MASEQRPSEQPAKPKEIRHADGRIEHPRVRFEPRDVRFRWVLGTIGATICFAAVQYSVVWLFFRDREQHQQVVKTSRYPLAPEPFTQLPEGPRLEQVDRLAGIESSDVGKRERVSDRLLATYGSTPEKGYIRIPIQRAMKLVIPDLPIRKQTLEQEHAKDDGLLYAGDSNSGRVFREAPR